MNSRERVVRALNFQETDRIPVDFGGTVVTCMDGAAHKRLCKHYGIQTPDEPVIDWTMGTVEPCDALKVKFHSDVRRVGMTVTPPEIVNDTYRDGFGMLLKQARPHAYFDVIVIDTWRDMLYNKTHKTWKRCLTMAREVNILQHSTAQHSTAQHSTAQHSTAQQSSALFWRLISIPSDMATFAISEGIFISKDIKGGYLS